MDIYNRDMILAALQKELLKQQDQQSEQLQYIAADTRENNILDQMRNDYTKHYQFMLDQKQEKERLLENLLEYLRKSMKQAELTQTLLLQSKHEKKRLLKEIDSVRKEIDELILDQQGIIS